MPAIPLTTHRLVLQWAGSSAADLSTDLVTLRFVDRLARGSAIGATLNNGGGSPPGFRHSAGTAVQLGVQKL